MIRATTPKHMFVFDTDPSEFKTILITYAQGDQIILEKQKDDLTIEEQQNACMETEYIAWFRMTQEETKLFTATPGNKVTVQVRVLTYDGESLASEKKTLAVQDVLNDEVLT